MDLRHVSTSSASPALATLYAAPRARLAQAIETAPGWRGFGRMRRLAIALNAALLLLIAAAAQALLLTYPGWENAAWLAAYGATALLSVLGLWPCRRVAWLAGLMLLANLAALGILGWVAALLIPAVHHAGGAVAMAVADAVLLGSLAPPLSVLGAQIGAWRRGRGA